MTKSKPRKNISRENLNYHNIIYDTDVFRPPCILPGHVDAVREALLSFDNIVPGGNGWRKTFQDELTEYKPRGISPESALPPDASFIPVAGYEEDLNERSPQWRTAYDNMKSCVEVAKSARKLEADMEPGWTNFWRLNTFTVVSETTKHQPGFHPVLDNWSLEGDCEWTEFYNLEPCDPNLNPRTRPKPDLAYAFPVVNRMFENLRGAERDDFSRCFSLEAIQMLAARGTISTVTTGLRTSTQSNKERVLSTTDRACFPWAVVEVKKQVPVKQSTPVTRCYCQAANAAAAAIALRAQLFDKVIRDAYSTMPPVIAFTCCGPEVRVWLMYYTEPDDEGNRVRRMVCVWSTSVLLTWGVASLRAIIMNMHTWASRILKPRIQACIFEILQRPEHPFVSRAHSPFREVAIAELFQTPRSEDSDPLSPYHPDDSPTLLNMDESPCRGKRNEAATDTYSPIIPPSRLVSSPVENPATRDKAPPNPDHGSSQNLYQDDTLAKHLNARFLFDPVDRLATPNQPGKKSTRTTNFGNQDEVAQITASFMSSHLEDTLGQKPQPHGSLDPQANVFEKSAGIEKFRNPTGTFGQSSILDKPARNVGRFGNTISTPKTTGGLFGTPATAVKTSELFVFGTPATAVKTSELFVFGTPATAVKTSELFVFGNPTTASKTTGGPFGNPTSTPKTTGGPFSNRTSTPKTGGLFSSPATASKTTGRPFDNPISTPKTTSEPFGNRTSTPKTTGDLLGNPTTAPKTTGEPFSDVSTAPKTTGGLSGSPTSTPRTTGRSCRHSPDSTVSTASELFRHPIDRSVDDDEDSGGHKSPENGSKRSAGLSGEETGSERPVSDYPRKSSSGYLLQGKRIQMLFESSEITRKGMGTLSYRSFDIAESVQETDGSGAEDSTGGETSDLEESSEAEDSTGGETSDLEESSGAEEFGDSVRRRRSTAHREQSDYVSPEMRDFIVPCRRGERWGRRLYIRRNRTRN